MATQRYISTSFWDDEWIQTLDPSEKLMFMYLMTNPLTNIAGVYKITIRRICFDTGFNSDTVNHIFSKFEKAGKVHRINEYVVLTSWPKHQKWQQSQKIKTGIDSCLFDLDKETLIKLSETGYKYDLKPFFDRLHIPYTYPIHSVRKGSNYSDSDSDIDLKNLYMPQAQTPEDHPVDNSEDPVQTQSANFSASSPSVDAGQRIDSLREYWNSKGLIPSRLPVFQLNDIERQSCMAIVSFYSDDEIKNAIDNYSQILNDKDHYSFPFPYQSFSGFMGKGVEKFFKAANPFDKFKKTVSSGPPKKVEQDFTKYDIKAEKYRKQCGYKED